MTPASLRIAIQELMERDGRERTAEDVRLALASRYAIKASIKAIKEELEDLCRARVLAPQRAPGGNNHIGIYKARVKQEAGQ